MNLYGYAGGDPINNSDPFGLMACPPLCDSFNPEDDRFIRPQSGREALALGAIAVGAAVGGVAIAGVMGAAIAGGTAAEVTLFSGGRQALRTALKSGVEGLSSGQTGNIARQLGKGAVDNIRITAGAGGAVTAEFTRAGRNGHQVLTKVLNAAGETVRMVQVAYDKAGKLVHGESWK